MMMMMMMMMTWNVLKCELIQNLLLVLWLQHLQELNTSDLPLLNKDQPEIYLDLRVSKPGRHVLLLNYLTPVGNNHAATTVHVETRTQRGRDRGRATLYACPYTSLCRQAVTDRQGRIAVFKFDSNFVNPVLKVSREHWNFLVSGMYALKMNTCMWFSE
jgi:hypothetical protein